MYGDIKGTFIYFADEKAAQNARETCIQKTGTHDIRAFCYIRAPKERGGVSISLQQKVRVKGLIDYSLTQARELLRTALIKSLQIPNVTNETNKYFERYIDIAQKLTGTDKAKNSTNLCI